MDAQELRQKQKDLLFPCVANYYEEPIVVAEANGVTVYDADGREVPGFLRRGADGFTGARPARCRVGDRRNRPRRCHTFSTLYITEPQLRVAARLAEIAPGDVSKSFFTNSGTEADETAVMLAKLHTGNQDMIVLRHGYSGRTSSATSMAGQKIWKPLPAQMPAVHHALSPYCYRCPLGLKPDNCGVRCAHDIEELINTTTPGAVRGLPGRADPGIGRVHRAAAGVLRDCRSTSCASTAACSSPDEVQTGVGPHRHALVRHRALGRRAGHHHDGKGAGEWFAGRSDAGAAGSRGFLEPQPHVLDVWRKPNSDGGGGSDAHRYGARKHSGSARSGWVRSCARVSRSCSNVTS